MSRILLWGTGTIAILVAALFAPIDFLIDDSTAPDAGTSAVSNAGATPPPTTMSRRSISAALSDSAAVSDQNKTATLSPTLNRDPTHTASAGTQHAALPPTTMPSHTAPPLFTGSNVVANAAPPASIAAIRAIQGELRRHGCYSGTIDGDWGPASRYAAATFTKAINAVLPVDQPDVALLVLARRHPGRACAPENGRGIATAATTAAVGAAIAGATAPHTARNPYAAAQPVTRAPRIVRSGGAPPVIAVTPTSPPGGTRPGPMALGIELPPGGVESAAPVTRPPPIAHDPASSAARARAKDRARTIRRRAQNKRRWRKRRRWRQQVFKPIDLGGQ